MEFYVVEFYCLYIIECQRLPTLRPSQNRHTGTESQKALRRQSYRHPGLELTSQFSPDLLGRLHRRSGSTLVLRTQGTTHPERARRTPRGVAPPTAGGLVHQVLTRVTFGDS